MRIILKYIADYAKKKERIVTDNDEMMRFCEISRIVIRSIERRIDWLIRGKKKKGKEMIKRKEQKKWNIFEKIMTWISCVTTRGITIVIHEKKCLFCISLRDK